MNYQFVAADVISKAIILVIISLWANCSIRGSYQWAVTSFSLSSLNNTLVVGVPLIRAMYGSFGENLVIQSIVLQALLWCLLLLFMLEFERAKRQLETEVVVSNNSCMDIESDDNEDTSRRHYVFVIMKIVALKVAKNPNSYGCVLGLFWALVANRWNLKMPLILEGSVLIMSRAGSGVAMFCVGLFMALQEKIIHCSVKLTIYGMVLRFVAAPLSLAVGSFLMGLRGDVLHIAIIQKTGSSNDNVRLSDATSTIRLHASTYSDRGALGQSRKSQKSYTILILIQNKAIKMLICISIDTPKGHL
ncbi:hypothetical protein QVD17_09406 [Tagetes erecta]|uniref:Auxin efflux carrier component n=1 Tax=Tagetes erecta TaxID=13708 RepID=A0AAD8KZ97_TARER|nr:hypothetical protein QVD17_09406 [Tagetes erecta]